jgi:hypothetical protein
MSRGYRQYHVGGGVLTYGGPFAISCRHSCSHEDTEHSAVFSSTDCGDSYISDDPMLRFYDQDDLVDREDIVVQRCLLQIRECDAVHAFIESSDCYGTLVELGFAAALNKPIYIVISTGLKPKSRDDDSKLPEELSAEKDEIWFVKNLPSVVACSYGGPLAIHSDLIAGGTWIETEWPEHSAPIEQEIDHG